MQQPEDKIIDLLNEMAVIVIGLESIADGDIKYIRKHMTKIREAIMARKDNILQSIPNATISIEYLKKVIGNSDFDIYVGCLSTVGDFIVWLYNVPAEKQDEVYEAMKPALGWLDDAYWIKCFWDLSPDDYRGIEALNIPFDKKSNYTFSWTNEINFVFPYTRAPWLLERMRQDNEN